MKEYLWDLQIDAQSCVWANEYNEAILKIKNHTATEEDYSLVKFHDLCIDTIHELQNEAKNVISQRDSMELRDFIRRILDLEAALARLIGDLWHEDFHLPDNIEQYFADKHYFDCSPSAKKLSFPIPDDAVSIHRILDI